MSTSTLSREQLVADLVDAARVESERRECVEALRKQGATWRQIGQVLDVDHAWLWRRYGRDVAAAAAAPIPAPRLSPEQQQEDRLTRGLPCVCGSRTPFDQRYDAHLRKHLGCFA